MNVGIVVYSQTGNTLSVCEDLKGKLAAAGHTVSLDRVSVAGERTGGERDFQLDGRPSIASYDVVIFGAAVEAFSLSPVLTDYLKQTDALEGKRVGCLVTQAFPFPWLGGNRAIRQMRKLCQAKGGSVYATGIVNWPPSRREATQASAIASLSALS